MCSDDCQESDRGGLLANGEDVGLGTTLIHGNVT
jgi:hypothetical protein